MTWFHVLVFAVAVMAGAMATVTGFGIGSLLTPLLAIRVGTKVAVAVISIPHFVATSLRLWMLRRHVHRRVLLGFGLASAAGGLAGALLHAYADSPALRMVFGGLLVFVGVMELTGLSRRMRFGRRTAWIAGVFSGMLGGMVGNQGGIRSAALLGFDVPKKAFIATATAVGVIVDLARMSIYLLTDAASIASHWDYIAIASGGAIVGTLVGGPILHRIPESVFRRVIAIVLLILGAMMLFGIDR